MALGLLVASAATLPQASATAQGTQQFVFEFEMAASRPTVADIFVDRGSGFESTNVVSVDIAVSAVPRPYSVPLSAGRYRAIRFDPFPDNGDFTLQRTLIRDRYGRAVATIPLSDLVHSEFVTVHAADGERLVATALPGHADPRLQYTFSPPLILWLARRDLAFFALSGLLIAIAAAGVAYLLLQRFEGPTGTWQRIARSPRRAVTIAAIASSLAATYPLLVGQSLVSPNNGPTTLIYNTPPYVEGSSDTAIENTRLADVQATMWVVLPYAVAQRAAVRNGEWPWWNRYSETGVPLLGQGQGSFFDPLHWLLFAGDVAVGADLHFLAARLVFTVGVGFLALVATESLGAALMVALAAPFISHFVGRFNDPIHFSIVYVPWILLGYGWLLRGPALRDECRAAAVLLVATALVMVSSSLKETFALLPSAHLAGVLAIAIDRSRTRDWTTATRRIALVAVAAAGAACLSAPHWLTFLETLANAFTAYDLTAFDFARLPQAVALAAGVFFPGMIYPGLNPVLAVLVVLAVVAPRQLWARPLASASAIVAGGVLLVAFGAVPEHILARLPLFSRIHHVGSTFLTAALPLLLVVAAAGASHLRSAFAGRAPFAGVIVAAATCVFVIVFALTANLSDPMFGLSATACVWTGVLCYLLLAAAENRARVTTAAAALVTAALLLPGGLHLHTGLQAADALLLQPRERATLTQLPVALAPAHAAAAPRRIVGLNGVMQGGVPAYLELESATGGDSLFSPHTYRLGQLFEPDYFPLSFRPSDPQTARLAPLFDLWSVGWLAGAADSSNRLTLIERPTAWPRALFVDRTEVHDGRGAFANRLRSNSRPFVSIDANDAQALALTRDRQGTLTVMTEGRDYRLTANTTAFTIEAPVNGVVVLNEGYWPGVSATRNTEASSVFRVNETMRGIVVPKGTWRVTFSYRPATWNWSLALATAGAVICLALLSIGRRHLRPRELKAPR